MYTPLDYDQYLSEKYQAKIYLKRENVQKVRSFKIRGAYYAISQLSEANREKGVVCASAGNHAQGVAYTCNEMQIPATIFMPITTPQQKISQVRFFGGEFVTIKLVGDTFDAGAPVKLAEIDKFADGIAVQKVGNLTYEVTRKHVENLIGVDEGLISEMIIDLYSKQGIVAEPAGVSSITALEVLAEYVKGKTICCILLRGNNDINRMPKMEERALIYDGIKHYFVVNFP